MVDSDTDMAVYLCDECERSNAYPALDTRRPTGIMAKCRRCGQVTRQSFKRLLT